MPKSSWDSHSFSSSPFRDLTCDRPRVLFPSSVPSVDLSLFSARHLPFFYSASRLSPLTPYSACSEFSLLLLLFLLWNKILSQTSVPGNQVILAAEESHKFRVSAAVKHTSSSHITHLFFPLDLTFCGSAQKGKDKTEPGQNHNLEKISKSFLFFWKKKKKRKISHTQIQIANDYLVTIST